MNFKKLINSSVNTIGMKMPRKHIANIGFVWLSTVLNAIFAFVTQTILARTLGTESFGLFAATIGFIGLFLPLAGFGTSSFWLKCFGAEGYGALRWLRPSLKFIAITTVILILGIHLWALFGPNEGHGRLLLLILVWTVLSTVTVNIVSAKFQLEGNFLMFSTVQLLPVVLRMLAVIFVVMISQGEDVLINIGWSYFLIAWFIIIFLSRHIIKLGRAKLILEGHILSRDSDILNLSKIKIINVFKKTWLFGLSGILYLAWNQGHIVFAKYFLGDVEAGIYSSAMVILTAISLLPSVAYSKFLLPKIHRWCYKDKSVLRKVYNTGNKIMIAFGILAMVIILLFSRWGILTVFGNEYSDAINILMILSLTLPMRFLGYSAGALMTTGRFLSVKIISLVIVTILNVALAFIFTPVWGILGLASTIIICEFVLVLFYFIYVNRYYFNSN